ncbi:MULTISPECIES: S26 family signal peptidase [unclassified Bradyrhizobium]|uniref:S26 family signal peptidase n=1 Tax=unclassified Bradyrhizobium TaxID=2631580 RepID=UPI0029165C8E|nr:MULTISPECIES: S26 family signal peptidase [unclassified Bradyrhizobium]
MTARLAPLVLAVMAAAAITATAEQDVPRYIWNLTPSVPRGLYAVEPPRYLHVTTLVVVRPPPPLGSLLDHGGYLPLGVPMLKRIFAVSGQTVCRIGAHINVDGIVAAPARERDGRGRPLPSWQGCHVIGNDEVFLMNWDEPDSFDGRYFGLLPKAAVVARAVPLWTDEAGDGRFVWRAASR